MDFVDLRHDVLVSTMIIESGLDIPRVNTLIVNRADRFGLAQLYQLRGRVGRSSTRAYAYLLLPTNRRVTEDAEKRLSILAESTELGSGMRLALRDLEIRGAGNILGAQQHGFMIDIGWELYCRLLEDAVREVRGEPVVERREVRVDTDISALLPDRYVEDAGERVAIYRRLIRMQKAEELGELTSELRDRFGALPAEARNLLGLQRVKLRAEEAGVEELRLRRGSLLVRFATGAAPTRNRLEGMVKGIPHAMRFSGREGLTVEITIPDGDPETRIETAEKCILSLGSIAG
jgi:transcription-repair coupling factor (superfamily II helicase)